MVAEMIFLPVGFSSWTKLPLVGENPHANIASQISVRPFFHGFAHNSLVSRPFLTRKVLNRRSQRSPRIGQGVVSSIQLLVRSTVWSNLGQIWSTLVKALQTLENVSRTTF